MSTETLNFEQTVNASLSRVYKAFTNATSLRQWLCDISTVDPKPGGRFYMAWNDGYYTSGEYTRLEKNQLVSFTWNGRREPGQTYVEVLLIETDQGTRLTLKHDGLGIGDAWEKTREECSDGWTKGLKNLASVLDTGEDQRFVLRPMLGILLTDFDEDIAEQLGIPVSKGVRIDDTVEDFGARAAGLQKDDVIIEMDGQISNDFASLGNVLNRHQAGDKIEVVFYRGTEKMSVMMELSRRPLHEIPETTAELAEAVKKRYKEMQKNLSQFLDGVTEEEASYKISPDEWSVKEVLAHLLQSEQFYQMYIAEVVGGHVRWADDFGGNLQAFIDATVSVYPTLNEMLAALDRTRGETVVLFTKMPPEFSKQKGSYWQLAYGVLEAPYHDNAHMEQMQACIDAARNG